MKTTIDISDDLARRARRLAQREGSTLRALVEEGLQRAIRARAAGGSAGLVIEPFGGEGLAPEFEGAGWERLRDEIYGDRG